MKEGICNSYMYLVLFNSLISHIFSLKFQAVGQQSEL